MTISDYNEYIKNYLENDNTKSAVMLTASWGAGKSYYIREELVPFVKEKLNKMCVCVSLYGLKNIDEVSKALYLEVRFGKFDKNNEKHTTTKVIGKTIVKGVASFFGINLDMDDSSLQELYDSVDLSGKLIILEDIERSGIDIIQILGYVSNLVEQDGVKVLLVANEQEFLPRELPKDNNTVNGKIQEAIDTITDREIPLTVKAKEYLRKKEKTVNDTILFETNKHDALKNIISSYFENKVAQCLLEEIYINTIIDTMKEVESDNLRAVLYACQKTLDIITICRNELDCDFIKSMFGGIIAYACRLKKGENVKWESDITSPANLGTAMFPLYRVCYQYMNSHYLYLDELIQTQDSYLRQKKLKEVENDFNKYFCVLRNYYYNSEEDVSKAVTHIKNLLSVKDSVSFSEYGALANYLIAVRDCISNTLDVDECKRLMLKNISEYDVDPSAESDIMYSNGIALDTEEQANELATFKEKLIYEINTKKERIFQNNSIDDMKKFIIYADSNKSKFTGKGGFLKEIDIDDFIDSLKKCNAKTISDVHRIFLEIYAPVNIGEFMSADLDNLVILKSKLEVLRDSFDGYDKIQKKQIGWFIGNLENIIQKL
mgnify:CR=1 FL=1